MKKVVGVIISLFILMGVSIGGYLWLVNKQIKNVESYLVKNGYEMEEVSFEEDTFRIVLKVESDEDELVKNGLMKTDLLNKISEDALYFNRGMILSFAVKENAKQIRKPSFHASEGFFCLCVGDGDKEVSV